MTHKLELSRRKDMARTPQATQTQGDTFFPAKIAVKLKPDVYNVVKNLEPETDKASFGVEMKRMSGSCFE